MANEALSHVSLKIEKGLMTGLIGHTGCGKSTLLRMFNGLLRPDSGRILLDGADIWESPKEIVRVRFRVGLVMQYPEYQLFDETVRSDIAGVMAMRPEILILDEPAAGLDPKGREDIFTGLELYRKSSGATVVIVSHSMEDMARCCQRLAVMSDGRICLYGTQSEVFGNAEKLQSLGLGVPEITRICSRLRQAGMPLPADIYTVEAAVRAILPLLGGAKDA